MDRILFNLGQVRRSDLDGWSIILKVQYTGQRWVVSTPKLAPENFAGQAASQGWRRSNGKYTFQSAIVHQREECFFPRPGRPVITFVHGKERGKSPMV